MRRKIQITVIVAVVGIALAWVVFHRQTRNVLPADVRRALDSGEQFVLLSLDPKRPSPRHDDDPPSKETFHGYAVLGEAVIHDQAIRKELLGALYKGVANSDGDQYACFYPRHGISATLAGEKVDLVICFECLSIDTYGKDKKIVLTTGSPGQTFDKALERAGLPAAQHK